MSTPSQSAAKKAVVIGPGRIGCGLVGQALHGSGWEVVFAGRGAAVANLARNGSYRVRLTSGRQSCDEVISGVRAVSASQPAAVAAEIASADLVAVAVGPGNLAAIAPLLAAGLSRRDAPVNVIAFENLADAGPRLAALVAASSPGALRRGHGFSGAVVSRVVARRVGDPAGSEPFTFVGDPPADFVVHRPSLRAPLPSIQGLRAVDDFDGWFLKKLFVFSAGHATTAYLGALKGYQYVHSAIRDPEIRASVLAAMEEGRLGLAARYGEALAGSREELEAIVARFENAALNDPIVRVGRDPRRKLGRDDRLVGAARLAARAGVRPLVLAGAAAAALCFRSPADPEAQQLQRWIDDAGVSAVIRAVTGLDPADGIGREVAEGFRRLAVGRRRDALLLSLERRMWSWASEAEAGERSAA